MAGMMTDEQRKIFNAACGDLEQLSWHGFRLGKDEWRHLLSGTILGWRTMPAVDRGDGKRGVIMFARSSRELTKEEASDAITLAFSIGDDPESQGLNANPIRWGPAVCKARWLVKE